MLGFQPFQRPTGRGAARGRTARAGRPVRGIWLLVAAVAAAGSCAPRGGGQGGRTPEFHGTRLVPPVERPDFALADARGGRFDFRRETDGDLALLYFGYTHCPDVCPVQMRNIAAALRDLPYEVSRRTRVVFVTVDPARDTADRLREWLAGFDSSFVGLRGDPQEVARIERSVGVVPAVAEDSTGTGGAIGHAAQVIAFTPDGLAHLAYPFGTRQQAWAEDIPRLLSAYPAPDSGSSAAAASGAP